MKTTLTRQHNNETQVWEPMRDGRAKKSSKLEGADSITEMISNADQSCLKPAFPICIAQPERLSACSFEAQLCTPEGVFTHKYSSGCGCGSGPLSATTMIFFAYTQLLL